MANLGQPYYHHPLSTRYHTQLTEFYSASLTSRVKWKPNLRLSIRISKAAIPRADFITLRFLVKYKLGKMRRTINYIQSKLLQPDGLKTLSWVLYIYRFNNQLYYILLPAITLKHTNHIQYTIYCKAHTEDSNTKTPYIFNSSHNTTVSAQLSVQDQLRKMEPHMLDCGKSR